MERRFKICQIHVCPVYRIGNDFKPDMEYPSRYCVIDNEKQIAIDIKTKLKYDYIQTVSHLYFMSQAAKKIKGNNRVAMFSYSSISYGKYNIEEAKNIIEQLKNNVEFQDGNEVYDNKSYLEYLKQEALMETQKNENKVKKFPKRKK